MEHLLLNHLKTTLIKLNLCTDHCLMFTLPIGAAFWRPRRVFTTANCINYGTLFEDAIFYGQV